MNEQTIILFFLIVSLGVTLSLYIFKAKKQMNYMGDERWEMIQLKSYRIASISTWSSDMGLQRKNLSCKSES